MSRVIKFRAWDKDEERMTVCMTLNQMLEKSPDPFYKMFKDDFEWMQFTGLFDKNKKEIYEGDIVHFKHDDGFFIEEITAPVNWYQDCYGTGWGRLTQHEDIEVIGNVYENPELLKEST